MKKIFLSLAIFIGTFSYGSKMLVMTEIFPPYQYNDPLDHKLIGISTEVVQAVQKKIGDKSKIKVYPWTRGIKLLAHKKNSAIFSILRTKEREDKYKWVGPLADMDLVFFKRKNSTISLKNLEDAKKVKKIGVAKGVGNYDILKAKGFTNLDIITSGTDEKNIKKLVKGRIDLWPALKTAGLYNARKLGFGGEIVPIENITIFHGALYIAFNKKTDDKVIKKWQDALDKLRKDGVISKIVKRY